MGLAWYCVNTNPQREGIALAHLQFQGFICLLPTTLRQYKRYQREIPLFPGYLFVRFDKLDDHWKKIHCTTGVRRLFSSDPQTPIPVQDDIIRRLEEASSNQTKGVARRIQVGDRLRVTGGPFTGQEVICTASHSDRVKALLAIMNRQVELTLTNSSVELV